MSSDLIYQYQYVRRMFRGSLTPAQRRHIKEHVRSCMRSRYMVTPRVSVRMAPAAREHIGERLRLLMRHHRGDWSRFLSVFSDLLTTFPEYTMAIRVVANKIIEKWGQSNVELETCRDCERACLPALGFGISVYDDGSVCAAHARHYVEDEATGELTHMEDLTRVWSSDADFFYTSDADAYYYDEGMGRYLTDEYRNEVMDTGRGSLVPVERRLRQGIGEYHSSKRYMRLLTGSIYNTRKLPLHTGIELEVEGDETVNLEDKAFGLMKLFNEGNEFPFYCLAENDGSLSHGFELVSNFGGLDIHERVLSRLKSEKGRELRRGLTSHDTNTCGLHVTIDRAGMTPLHKGKLVVFTNSPVNRSLFEAVCRRYLVSGTMDGGREIGGYSVAKPRYYNKVDRRSGIVNNRDRYEMWNFARRGVIEFRAPRGTLRFATIMAVIEFTRMCWLFSRDTSVQQLTTAAFLNYIALPQYLEETKYLRPYLISKGFVVSDRRTGGRDVAGLSQGERSTLASLRRTADV